MNKSKEIIKEWRDWNADQIAKGKVPEPFFSKWWNDKKDIKEVYDKKDISNGKGKEDTSNSEAQ